jgi:Zn-dependent metalloprotease
MKIVQQKLASQCSCGLAKLLTVVLCLALLSPTAFGNSFVFPDNVSIVQSTMVQSFTGSKSLKSVGLRDESSLAGFVRSSILAPQPSLKGSVANSLVLVKISADGKHARYSQRFNGYEVFGGEVIAHLDEQGENLDRVTGNFITGLEQATIFTKVELDRHQAIEVAKQQMDDYHQWNFENSQIDLVVYHNPNTEGFQPALAYIVNFLATSDSAEPTRPFVVVDAKTGEILDRWEGLNT